MRARLGATVLAAIRAGRARRQKLRRAARSELSLGIEDVGEKIEDRANAGAPREIGVDGLPNGAGDRKGAGFDAGEIRRRIPHRPR